MSATNPVFVQGFHLGLKAAASIVEKWANERTEAVTAARSRGAADDEDVEFEEHAANSARTLARMIRETEAKPVEEPSE